jgi:glycine/D-amino acid oxidase-like deaminating enzyme
MATPAVGRTSDVIVIGGGVVGLSVAVHLRWLGVSVTLLERDRIGAGTSTRGFGTVSALRRRPASELRLMLAAQSYFPALADRLGCPEIYRVTGALALIRDERELDAHLALTADQRAVEGFVPPDVLDAATLREIEPALGDAYRWGVYRAEDAQVEPRELVEGLRAGAVRHGVSLIQGARVEATRRQADVWRLDTPAGTFTSPTVVNCAGVWAEQVGRLAGMSIPARCVRGQVVVLEAGDKAVQTTVSAPGRVDIRQASDGRYWLGTVEQVDSWDLDARAEDTAGILERVSETLSGIADLPISEVWAGLRPVPADGLPLVGPLAGAEGYFVAVGHDGLSYCGVEGRALAAHIAGGAMDPLLAPFDPKRPMPGWQPPQTGATETLPELLASATRHAMRTDGTDWSRVATIASRSSAASRRMTQASMGLPLRTRGPGSP